jgi:hypothetical protein
MLYIIIISSYLWRADMVENDMSPEESKEYLRLLLCYFDPKLCFDRATAVRLSKHFVERGSGDYSCN